MKRVSRSRPKEPRYFAGYIHYTYGPQGSDAAMSELNAARDAALSEVALR